jgi:hypothetical protein
MGRKSREQIVKELTDIGVDFDARESYEYLDDLLKIETRNRKPSPQQPKKPEVDKSKEPLSDTERQELARLEAMARKGRKIDQPTPEEMLKLGRLRMRASL